MSKLTDSPISQIRNIYTSVERFQNLWDILCKKNLSQKSVQKNCPFLWCGKTAISKSHWSFCDIVSWKIWRSFYSEHGDGNFVPFVRGAFEKVTTWSHPILDLPPDQNGQYYQKLTLGARGLEEHIMRITVIFARIIGFMLFTVVLSRMYDTLFRRISYLRNLLGLCHFPLNT